MERVIKRIVTWLIKNEAIEEDERELYEYAIYSLIFMVAPLIMSVGIGSIFGELRMSVILILPFMLIRKYSGGYHAKKQWICLLLSSVFLAFCFAIASVLVPGIWLLLIVILAGSSLAIFSPVDSENRRLDEYKRMSYRKTSRILVMLFVMFYILMCMVKADTCAVYLALGIILPAGLQMPCVLQKG